MEDEVYEEIVKEILEEGSSVHGAKARVCKKYSLSRFPSNSDVLSRAPLDKRPLLIDRLKKKPIRTLSGVAVVAVMTSPAPCPHGRCAYCPTGEGAPQSYTGHEPAALRGKRSGFDPYTQVFDRLKQLHTIGHSVEKAELIVMGGTFPAREREYQEWFIRRCFDAMNSFNNIKMESTDIEEAHVLNEMAIVRNVGLTFETRPDFAMEDDVNRLLSFGVTRIELGVQTLREEVYQKMSRGHTIKDVIDSTRIIKDAGLKLGYHMMPGLFSNPDRDREMFESLFSSPDFKPDMLKIYPTLVLKGTRLFEMWKRGEFVPFTLDETLDLIVEIKKMLPAWVRTMRIQRDIPAGLIEVGVKRGNLGELVQERLEEEGVKCRCIRCRDAGHLDYKKGVKAKELDFVIETYDASLGAEHFISIEDSEQEVLAGYLRMRFPSLKAGRSEVGDKTAIIRELRVLGLALRIGERNLLGEQHKGIGRSLLQKAERIAKNEGMDRLIITSAVGSREYYRKLGFTRNGRYMEKNLEL
jgi:elongator complex protein 3